MKRTLILLLFLSMLTCLAARNPDKKAIAVRIEKAPRIDGYLDDAAWQNIIPIKDFMQFIPVYNVPASHPIEVKFAYDDEAIYVGARMYDPYPDSILHQLGNRDDENLNVDRLGVVFDTYDNELDAYIFIVAASGVQYDQRVQDASYNAVWESKARIDEKGWVVEMKIPYSALRFPKTEVQNWGLQVVREVRRNREADQWALEEKGVPNSLKFWGMLEGIQKITPPLRLSVTPYLSSSISSSPSDDEKTKDLSTSFNGGMDLKYGINESFTIDMTLLPDFSQVQSDSHIKNLSAFETIYDEQRPFFMEAVDLFGKGELFYTRRIGRIPLNYFDVAAQVGPGEKLKQNPVAAKMINATKFSGRTRKGLAIGLFNAVTNNTYAEITDSTGKTRKFLTDPLTNYNIVVFDQALKNNSSVYLINTNVTRDKGYNKANVTGTGLTLYNKENTYGILANAAVSQLFEKDSNRRISGNTTGLKYDVKAGKVKGRVQFYYLQSLLDDKFSANDMGITLTNNEFKNQLYFSLNQYEPKGGLRESNLNLAYTDNRQYTSGMNILQELSFNCYGNTMNYLSLFGGATTELTGGYDFYEPRVAGRYYLKPIYTSAFAGFSSDYRKPLALDGNVNFVFAGRDDLYLYYLTLMPLIRVNDHLFMTYQAAWEKIVNDIGFATKDNDGNPVFGNRDVTEITNTINARYLFRNNLSLNLRLRHYFSSGTYDKYYHLNNNGTVTPRNDFTDNTDFNFNAFNIDLVFNWEFAPGSNLNLIWKNAITDEGDHAIPDYIENLHNTLGSPQTNTFTLKMLYYLDYQYLKKTRKKA